MKKQTIILISVLSVSVISAIVIIFYFKNKSNTESEAVRLERTKSDARIREEQLKKQMEQQQYMQGINTGTQIGSSLGAGIGGIIGMFATNSAYKDIANQAFQAEL